ncbi:MAG: phage replication protein [Enterococcus italicus]|uniref:phage replication protein n=1 Tax=Enterococcus italicus TaxID=246144 RepID=UPI003990EDBE
MAELNIRQDRFLKAMLQCASVDEACKQAGINRTTGYKYLKDDVFLAEYRSLRREAMQQVTAQLQKKSEEAVAVLAEVMNDKEAPAGSRVASAKNVLDVAYRSLELDDMAAEMEKIKSMLGDD